MRSIQTICNKSDLNITSGMIARCVCINIAVVKPLSLVGGWVFFFVFFGGLRFLKWFQNASGCNKSL